MRYPGGKGRCFQHIISVMRPHDVYIETHLGGGSIMRRKRPARASIGVELDRSVVERWVASTGAPCKVINGDAVDFLCSYSFTGRELVYSDPPYLPATRRRSRVYRYDYTEEDHLSLIGVLRSLPCDVVLSGYRSDLYDRELADWHRIDFPGDSHVGPTVESAWLNYVPGGLLHDHSHIGVDFRDRERIRRRRSGLTKRIADLPDLERGAFLEEVALRYRPEIVAMLETIDRG